MTSMNNIALETLKKEGSVRIYPGMVVSYFNSNQEEILNLSELVPKFNGCYATNNSTVCFVTDGEIYVTPNTHFAISILTSTGFYPGDFYVPFSNGDCPKNEMQLWITLREKARKTYADEFIADCNEYCNKHYIGSISEDSLRNCFQIPAEGVVVKHRGYFEQRYYPIITSCSFDCIAAEKIGRYCTNNGRVVFVYRDGKTYVAKNYKIVEELRAAGYREHGLFVPFSNGEEIQDPDLKAQWESITK